MSEFGFSTSFEQATQREVGDLPAGWYRFDCISAVLKDTKAGDGKYVEAEISVLEPESLAKWRMWPRFNVSNANSKAEEIGRRQLNCLARAMGVEGLSDTSELVGHSFVGKVRAGKPDPQYGAKPEIAAYYFPDEGKAEPPLGPTVPAAPVTAQARVATRVQAPANQNAPQPIAAVGNRPWGGSRRA